MRAIGFREGLLKYCLLHRQEKVGEVLEKRLW